MKKVLLLLIIVISVSCKNEAKKDVKKEAIVEVKKENFPDDLGKVFEKHGGKKHGEMHKFYLLIKEKKCILQTCIHVRL